MATDPLFTVTQLELWIEEEDYEYEEDEYGHGNGNTGNRKLNFLTDNCFFFIPNSSTLRIGYGRAFNKNDTKKRQN
jgi:hypothetical protein